MVPEMTSAGKKAQHAMVVRSMMVAPTRAERSEERPRKHVQRLSPPVFADPPSVHRYIFPVVNELKPL